MKTNFILALLSVALVAVAVPTGKNSKIHSDPFGKMKGPSLTMSQSQANMKVVVRVVVRVAALEPVAAVVRVLL
jgi:hypothetical protein